MAKKSGKQVARRKDAARVAFDDKKYGHALFSATFEYSELTLARASEQLGLRLRSALTAASFASLVGLILVILIDESLVVLVGVLFVISLALVFTTSRWGTFSCATRARPPSPPRPPSAATWWCARTPSTLRTRRASWS